LVKALIATILPKLFAVFYDLHCNCFALQPLSLHIIFRRMKLHTALYIFFVFCIGYIISAGGSSCAQIGSISGGNKDTIAPVLVAANPKIPAVNITGKSITLTFNEYVEVADAQNNLLVSPYPQKAPEISYKLKTVSIKLKDTLLPNTTYALNFGNAIRDVNEGNPLMNFTYVFSTGSSIDSLTFSGKVQLAETGQIDSTINVLLYRNANDSSVQQKKPQYMAKLNGDGSFKFINLPAGTFSVYALKDGDGSKTYNSKTEIFAFADAPVVISDSTTPVQLYAYAAEKREKEKAAATKPKAAPKKLRYNFKALSEKQDLRKSQLEIEFTNGIKLADSTKIFITDTNYNPVATTRYTIDSNKLFITAAQWTEDADYRLIISKGAVTDISDSTITKADTLKFQTKRQSDYGNVVLRFKNIDFAKHPVLQFVQGEIIAGSYALTAAEWRNKLFMPGEYEIRILYDDNNNGKWDPGEYAKKRQPEKVIALPKKFAVKENWDNESDINL
jgi:hypothetical protein